MKERPILFSAPMVRALLAGTKTQTRRVVKLSTDARNVRYWAPPGGRSLEGWADPGVNYWTPDADGETSSNHLDVCPYGQPGDRLWVREAFLIEDDRDSAKHIVYRADGAISVYSMGEFLRWKPSIHMPRWACRLVLEVVAVRVERLQDISEEDAKAEGCDKAAETTADDERLNIECGYFPPSSYAHGYRLLWEQINGAGSWDANPWVWVVEFRRAAAEIGKGEAHG